MSEPIDRETLAKALHDAYFEPGCGPQDWDIVADKAIELCAGRVPAGVWGLVERFRAASYPSEQSARHNCADELEAALNAVPKPAEPAPRALPTREEIAISMHDAFREMRSSAAFPPKPWVELCSGMQDGYRFVADRVITMLREYASAEPPARAAEPALCTLEQAGEINRELLRLYSGSPDGAMRAAVNRVLGLGASGEVEALRVQLVAAQIEAQTARLETKNVLSNTAEGITRLERERDEARGECQHYQAELNECQDAFEKAISERNEARRQRDEALSELERVTALYDRSRSQAERALEAECAQLRAQLAARPEPVVIDEALAQAVLREMAGTEPSPASERPANLCAILKRRIGNTVCVAALPFEIKQRDEALVEALTERGQLRAELAELRERYPAAHAEAEDLLRQVKTLEADLAEANRLVDVRTNVMRREKGRADGLDAELKRTIEAANQNYAEAVRDWQKTQTDLIACRMERDHWMQQSRTLMAEIELATREVVQLRIKQRELLAKAVLQSERYDALRAGVEDAIDSVFQHINRITPAGTKQRGYVECAQEVHAQLCDLLKPVTPEPRATGWQHISSGGDSHTFRNGSTGEERTLDGFATAHAARPFIGEPVGGDVLTCPLPTAVCCYQAKCGKMERRQQALALSQPQPTQHSNELSAAADAGTEETSAEYAKRRLARLGIVLEQETAKALAESRIVLGPGQDSPIVPPERTGSANAKPGEQLATRADVERLERDNRLLWQFVEAVARPWIVGPPIDGVVCGARDALDARKAVAARAPDPFVSPNRMWLRFDALARFVRRVGGDGSISVHTQAERTVEELDAIDAGAREGCSNG